MKGEEEEGKRKRKIRPNKIICLFGVTWFEKIGTDGRKKILFYEKILFAYTKILT